MKNNQIKITALLILAVLVGILAVACSNTGDDAANTAANIPDENTEVTGTSTITGDTSGTAEFTTSMTTEVSTNAEPALVRVMALKGPTAMGLVDFMSKADSGEITTNDYKFSIASAPDEVSANLAKGETDVAAIPANLAAVLYAKTKGAIQVLGINTLGVLYICGQNTEITDISALNGKTIYAGGKGATPELVLNHLLSKAGVEANIEWKSEHAECVAALINNEEAVAMLPQPFATAAQLKNPAIAELIDLNTEWENLQDNALITGVVVVRKDFATEHPEVIEEFMEYYYNSVITANSNTDDIAELIADYDIVPANIAKSAIPKCNIVLITGSEMKTKLSAYLEVLYTQDPKSVGGQLPDADFYYNFEYKD